jgi:hypothetical protein
VPAVFAASAARRLAVAAVYAAAVAAAVWSVGRSAEPETAATVPAPAAVVPGRELVITATFPVARWVVLVDGTPVAGTATASSWTGRVAGREVLVQAERSDPSDLTPGAVRVAVAGREFLAWGEGPVSLQAVLP